MHRGVGDSGALLARWTERLLNGADLEGCLGELDGVEHFHAATMRGRLLSLLMRPDDARREFDRALRLGEDEPEDIPTLVRLFLLIDCRAKPGSLLKSHDRNDGWRFLAVRCGAHRCSNYLGSGRNSRHKRATDDILWARLRRNEDRYDSGQGRSAGGLLRDKRPI